MFWAFLAFSAVAVALVKLGALSAWVTFLTAGLQLAAFLAIVLVVIALWRLVAR
jgi:hypothetical protein